MTTGFGPMEDAGDLEESNFNSGRGSHSGVSRGVNGVGTVDNTSKFAEGSRKWDHWRARGDSAHPHRCCRPCSYVINGSGQHGG